MNEFSASPARSHKGMYTCAWFPPRASFVQDLSSLEHTVTLKRFLLCIKNRRIRPRSKLTRARGERWQPPALATAVKEAAQDVPNQHQDEALHEQKRP